VAGQPVADSDRFALLFVLLIGDYILLTLVNSIQWGGLLRGCRSR